MEYTSVYKNGKPAYFFIKTETPEEYNFIQPYFLLTDSVHTRCGKILEMECLFSGSVWYGRQRHGYGYSPSHDVYGQLVSCIQKLYGDELSDAAHAEIRNINTDDRILHISESTLNELSALNMKAFERKYM